jgi:hypothetical protein
MKNFFKKISSFLLGALVVLGFMSFGINSESPNMLNGVLEIQTISIKFDRRIEEGQIPYNFIVGDYTYHFWDLEQIEQFSSRVDYQDDKQTALVRKIIKQELETKSVETLTEELKTRKTYNINNVIQ